MILEWLIIGSISLAFLLSLGFIILLTSSYTVKRKLSQLGKSVSNNKKTKRKKKRDIRLYENLRKKRVKQSILVGVSLIVTISISVYAMYYQRTTLSESDREGVVQGHYLLDQMEKQLANVKEVRPSSEKQIENIYLLSIKMASFSSKRSSDWGTKESQLLLNRYYRGIGQLGVNLSAQTRSSLFENDVILSSYNEELTRVKKSEREVISFYKIEESSLTKTK